MTESNKTPDVVATIRLQRTHEGRWMGYVTGENWTGDVLNIPDEHPSASDALRRICLLLAAMPADTVYALERGAKFAKGDKYIEERIRRLGWTIIKGYQVDLEHHVQKLLQFLEENTHGDAECSDLYISPHVLPELRKLMDVLRKKLE